MIKSFKHKGLQTFFELGSPSGIQPQHTKRIRHVLTMLNATAEVKDMTAPGLKLHELKGNRKNTYAVTVSGNWRITFKMLDADVIHVNYEDYH
jgi:proteic killer suppression protein